MKRPAEGTFGSELRRLRRSDPRNINLAVLADAVGISLPYLSDIERDARLPPPPPVVEKMLIFLNQADQIPRLLKLAAESRQTIQISLDKKTDTAKQALVALARQSESISHETWEKILKLIDAQEG